jgi:hypothetical protein
MAAMPSRLAWVESIMLVCNNAAKPAIPRENTVAAIKTSSRLNPALAHLVGLVPVLTILEWVGLSQ